MSAEPIARVIADLRAKRVVNVLTDDPELFRKALDSIIDPVVVDATEIYTSLVDRDDPVAIYEDHPCIAPPWREAAICYVNGHGNVVVMVAALVDWRHDFDTTKWHFADPRESWDSVKWVYEVFVWCGGKSSGGGTLDPHPVPTGGPLFSWLLAIGPDGRPIDLRWVHLDIRIEKSNWDMANLVLLGTLNFMNCRNIELVEPVRQRAERRRLARIGVTVNTIQVRPTQKASRSGKADRSGPSGLVPLTSVRGHFAHYGDCCPMRHPPRGKLFGQLTGRYWIPQHARGSVEAGEAKHDYQIKTGAN